MAATGTTVGCNIVGIEIIQWLRPSDRKTGSELERRIAAMKIVPVTLHSCHRAADVLAALAKIRTTITPGSAPLIHIEAHGYGKTFDEPDKVPSRVQTGRWLKKILQTPAGIGGPGLKGGRGERLGWRKLLPLLCAMNVASGYHLQVVTAACFGYSLKWGILASVAGGGVLPVPFIRALGPDHLIDEDVLAEGTFSFYDELLPTGDIDLAMLAANRAMKPHGTFILTDAYSAAREALDATGAPPSAVLRQAVASMFGHAQLPANAARFPNT